MNPFQRFGKLLYLKGTHSMSIPAGESVTSDYTLTESLTITGGTWKGENVSINDKVSFKIVVGETVANVFVDEFYPCIDGAFDYYAARLEAGMKVRVVYENNGDSTVEFRVNCHFHRDQ